MRVPYILTTLFVAFLARVTTCFKSDSSLDLRARAAKASASEGIGRQSYDLRKRVGDEFTVVVFDPPAFFIGAAVMYARMMKRYDENATLLITFENGDPSGLPHFPIYQSKDNGHTWKYLSQVDDTVNGWGMRYEPQIYELPEDFAEFKKGDILVAGNSIPNDQSHTSIDVYVSRDKGFTWTFVSNIAKGGRSIPNNGETPVWEPFFVLYEGILICYYSDQRDSRYGQKLVYVTTTDLHTWSDVVDIVVSPTYGDRPGMPVVTQIEANGLWMLAYEFCCYVQPLFRIRYKLAYSPLDFADAREIDIVTQDGQIPTSSPYVIYTPAYDGLVVLSSGVHKGLWINDGYGDPNHWFYYPVDAPYAYSRSLTLSKDPRSVFIVSGGPGNGTNNNVTVTLKDLLFEF